MKTKFLSFFLFCISIYSTAQSTDLDRESIIVSYVKLPSNPVLDENLRTYSVHVNSTIDAESVYPSRLIKENIILEGFDKINANGTIDVQIQIGDVVIDEITYNESEEVKKDKEGNITSRQKYYRPIVNYHTDASYFIQDHKGERREFPLHKKDQFKANKYKTKKEAEKYVNANLSSLKNGFNKEFIRGIASNVSYTINSNFGYVTQTNATTDLWILDSKKHPENEGHHKALNDIREIFKTMKYDEPITQIQEKVRPVINYFESIIPKYPDPKKGKHKKMRYASYFNIAKLYLYLDMPEETIIYANKLIENGYDKSDGKYLVDQAEQLKEKFLINGVKSRHFEVVTTDNSFDETTQEIIEVPVTVVIPLIDRYDTIYNSSGDVTADNTILKTTLKTIKHIFAGKGNQLGAYPLESDILTDDSGRITGQQFIVPDNGNAFKFIYFNWEGDKLTYASLGEYRINLYWKDNYLIRIKGLRFSDLDYVIRYDNQNNPIYLESNTVLPNGLVTGSFELSYVDNRIVKSVRRSKTLFKEYVEQVKDFKYENDWIKIDKVRYKKGKPSEPKYEITNNSEHFKRISDHEVEIKYIFNESGAQRITHYNYRPDGQHNKRVLHELPNDRKIKYDMIYEGDKLVKQIVFTTKKGLFFEKEITNTKDLLRKPEYTEDYQWRNGKYRFDKNDELFFESRNMKYREKRDGFWTGWLQIQY